MQFIPKKWYLIYNWVLVALSCLYIVAYIISKSIHSFTHYGISFGLTLNGSILAVFAIGAGMVGYRVIGKKMGTWLGAILTTMLFDLLIIYQLNVTGHPYNYLYIALWWALAAYSGAFGVVVVLTSNFLALIICIQNAVPNLNSLPSSFRILLAGSLLFSILPYVIFWKKKIERSKTSDHVSEIEGMPDDTKTQNETLIESIADGIIVTDTTGKISLINPSACEMSEWDSVDALGVDINLVIKIMQENGQEIEADKNPFTQVIQTNKKVDMDALLVGHRGKKIIISLVVSPVVIEGKTVGLVAVIRDISVQRAAEKQRADFISTASHEMRTPVAAIEGYISLAMNDRVSSIDTRARGYLDKAHQSTQRLGKLFQDLLTSSRAEDGRLVNHPQVVEVNQFIQHLAESFQLAGEKKHLIVDFVAIGEGGQVQPTTGKMIAPLYYVHVDPDRMSEVLTNLFDNAVKYTEAGKIIIGVGGDANTVQVFIQDTGVGIPPEDVPHLFQKFYRVDNSSVRTIGGTGLGLFICKKIVELYGGQIWVESVLGKGSTFRINLPRLSTQQAESLKQSEAAQNEIAMPSSNLSL